MIFTYDPRPSKRLSKSFTPLFPWVDCDFSELPFMEKKKYNNFQPILVPREKDFILEIT
jgi:hypothetical protein